MTLLPAEIEKGKSRLKATGMRLSADPAGIKRGSYYQRKKETAKEQTKVAKPKPKPAPAWAARLEVAPVLSAAPHGRDERFSSDRMRRLSYHRDRTRSISHERRIAPGTSRSPSTA